MHPRRPRTSLRAPLAAALAASLVACAGAPPPCPPAATPQAPPAAKAAPAPALRTPFEGTRSLEIKLAPRYDPAGQEIVLEVSMRFSLLPSELDDGAPLVLRLRDVVSEWNVEGRIQELFARDAEGALALTRAPADPAQRRQLVFKAERRARGPLSVSYRARLSSNRLALSTHDDHFMASGQAFLLLPATSDTYTVRVQWDIEKLSPQAKTLGIGVSSLGEGNFEREARLSELEGAVWASGNLHRTVTRSASGDGHFGMTVADWDASVFEVSASAARLWFFGRNLGGAEGGPTSLEMFLRPVSISYAYKSEAGDGQVRVLSYDTDFDWLLQRELARAVARAALGFTVTDEAGPAGWFEGLVTYWAYDISMRDLPPTEQIRGDLAAHTERYFASPLRNMTLAEVAQPGPDRSWHIEDRGLLYAGELNAALMAYKDEEHKLDRLMRDLRQSARREPGSLGVVEQSTFVAAVEKLLGKRGKERFEAVVLGAGAMPEVPGWAYGPCFDKVKKRIRLTTGKEIVEGFSWIRRPQAPQGCWAAGR